MKTKIVKTDEEGIRSAVLALEKGEMILMPTETVYGLAARADCDEAVSAIYDLKGRDINKPLSIMVSDLSLVSDICELDGRDAELFKELGNRYWPGAMTLVLKKKDKISDRISAGKDSVGIRIPKHDFALRLLKAAGKPLVVTSANISGEAAATDFEEAYRLFNGKVAVIVEGEPPTIKEASSVIEIRDGKTAVLREGIIKIENRNDQIY